MKVLIVPNYQRSDAIEDSHKLGSWLESRGYEPVFWSGEQCALEPSEDVWNVGLVLSLGGDGTLLRAARMVEYREVPIVGISYGHLGFLTSAGPTGLFQTVRDALEGTMHASHRATLDIEATFRRPDGTTFTKRKFGLNELAVSRGGRGDMIQFEVEVSGNHIDELRGDGFVVSTATGSTGYALAAGGPIVTPEFNGMVCVPIAPHTIMARAFLTSPNDVVEIVMSDERPAESCVFVDGRPLGEGFELVRASCRRGPGDVILLDYSAQSFYDSVSRVFYGKAGK